MHEKSSRVMVETCLESISKNEDKINSMITVTAEDACDRPMRQIKLWKKADGWGCCTVFL